MNKIFLYLAAWCVLFAFASCSENDEPEVAKAVMTSAQSLEFDGLNASSQTITVYSDATWTVDLPEWISVSPSTGSGTTDVIVSVDDNLRDGLLDNPRKGELVFHGATVASRATVKVTQKGDNYRDCRTYSVEEILQLEDETYLEAENIHVYAVTSKGVIGSDDNGKSNVLILAATQLTKGDVISISGQKASDDMALPIVKAEKVTVKDREVASELVPPTDVTANIDSYNPGHREYLSATGILNGNSISIEGASNSIVVADLDPNIDLSPLNGHVVQVYGFYAGVASPFVRINYADIKDMGEAQIIYWWEDFEWLAPFAEASKAGRTVETDDLGAAAPQIVNAKLADGMSALDALLDKGYNFLRVTTKTEGECIYLQQNYLKFGKTSYQAGIIFPTLDNIPSEAKVLLSFDWCPMRQGSGKIDPVNLILIIKNGSNEVTFEIPTHNWEKGHRLEWINETVELSGVKIDKDTQITLRQTQWPASTANRWFLDNIKLYSKL